MRWFAASITRFMSSLADIKKIVIERFKINIYVLEVCSFLWNVVTTRKWKAFQDVLGIFFSALFQASSVSEYCIQFGKCQTAVDKSILDDVVIMIMTLPWYYYRTPVEASAPPLQRQHTLPCYEAVVKSDGRQAWGASAPPSPVECPPNYHALFPNGPPKDLATENDEL